MTSFLFIDDSGSKQWDTPYSRDFVDNPPARNVQNRNFWQENYFVLAGLHIDGDLIAELNPIINERKVKVFGTKHVEIRSVNLRNPEKRAKYYIDKFGVAEEDLREFIEDFWYKLFEDYKDKIQIQTVVIDKRYYKNNRFEIKPLQIATQVLFDRIELHPNHQCVVIFDQMDHQVKTDKRDQGQILQISNRTINLGSFREKYTHIHVGFEESKNSNFLQLADTAAYNVLRQFVDYGDQWEDASGKLPMYTYFDRISDNLYCDPASGRVKGYGIIKVPDPNGKNWSKTQQKNT